MDSAELNWRAEEACMNAWPSPKQIVLGKWLLRLSGGTTRRTNTVNPLRGCDFDPAPVMDACADIYAANGLPLIFRVPAFAKGMDEKLNAQGFAAYDETLTLFADFAGALFEADKEVELAKQPSEDFFALRAIVNNNDEAADRIYRAMTDLIALPKAFVGLRAEGKLVSIAYGAIHRNMLVVESVGTAQDRRNQGFSRRVLGTLMHWAKANGATGACLQVLAANAPAIALYRRLGFTTDLYRYHYSRRDGG